MTLFGGASKPPKMGQKYLWSHILTSFICKLTPEQKQNTLCRCWLKLVSFALQNKDLNFRHILLSEDSKMQLFGHNDHGGKKGETCTHENTILALKYEGESMMFIEAASQEITCEGKSWAQMASLARSIVSQLGMHRY